MENANMSFLYIMLYYFSSEVILQRMAKNNPTEKKYANIQATLKHAPEQKLTEEKI